MSRQLGPRHDASTLSPAAHDHTLPLRGSTHRTQSCHTLADPVVWRVWVLGPQGSHGLCCVLQKQNAKSQEDRGTILIYVKKNAWSKVYLLHSAYTCLHFNLLFTIMANYCAITVQLVQNFSNNIQLWLWFNVLCCIYNKSNGFRYDLHYMCTLMMHY